MGESTVGYDRDAHSHCVDVVTVDPDNPPLPAGVKLVPLLPKLRVKRKEFDIKAAERTKNKPDEDPLFTDVQRQFADILDQFDRLIGQFRAVLDRMEQQTDEKKNIAVEKSDR